MDSYYLILGLIIAPLVGFVVNGIRFRKNGHQLAGAVATSAVCISFICAIVLFCRLVGAPVEQRVLNAVFFDWISVGGFSAKAGFSVDVISGIMILIITGVGSLIHLFSVGYMSHDKHPAKYFAYLNLFIFNMLLLVLGDNLLVMFVGWEGVGLSSNSPTNKKSKL